MTTLDWSEGGSVNRSVSLAELAGVAKGEVLRDPEFVVRGVCSLRSPAENCLAFAKTLDGKDQDELRKAGIALLVPRTEQDVRLPAIAVDNPRFAFAELVNHFFAPEKRSGIAPSAHIHESAVMGRDVAIGHGCVLGPGCEIGDGTELRHNVVVGERVKIGRNCLIKSGAVIGEEGFGFEQRRDGSYLRIPHLGSVTIGDEVEIGATTVICQGTIDSTSVGDRTKIDDHVFVAHNCRIGEDVIIIACAEVSGSVEVGPRAWIGPNAAILNGIRIAADSLIGMGAVVTKPTEEGGIYAGSPARLLRFKGQ